MLLPVFSLVTNNVHCVDCNMLSIIYINTLIYIYIIIYIFLTGFSHMMGFEG